MRKWVSGWLLLLITALAGCGDGSSGLNTKPWTAEERKAIADQDALVQQEEGGNNAKKGRRK